MKKNIGNNLALYPTPLAVVGTIVNNKPNYVLVGHLGIIGHDHVMVSLSKTHYTNRGIKENRSLTINLVDEKKCLQRQTMLAVSAGIQQTNPACLIMIPPKPDADYQGVPTGYGMHCR